MPLRVTIFSLYNVTAFFIFVSFLLFCADSSDPRSPTVRRIWNAREAAIRQREAHNKHQLHDTRIFSRISNDDPCFGIDTLKGFWNNRTRKFESSTCNIEPIRAGLFDEESSEQRLRLAQCFSNRKWVVLMGDSNSRGMFNILCDILSKTLGAQSVFHFGGDETNAHGDARWSDREFIFPGSTVIGPFRLSFRFYSSYRRFQKQIESKFQQDFEYDLTLEKQQIKGSLFEKYVVPYGKGYPSVLLISSGLWDLKCSNAIDTYEILTEKLQQMIPNILYFPPAHIKKHPSISNSMIKGIHTCVIEKRNKELIDVLDRGKLFRTQQLPGVVPILDIYKMTEKMPLDWIKGYHFGGSSKNPIAQTVLSYLLKFTCK